MRDDDFLLLREARLAESLAEMQVEVNRLRGKLSAAERLAVPQWRGQDGLLHLPNDDDPVACYVQGYNACIDDLRQALGSAPNQQVSGGEQ